jgi:ribulose-phosphate 3-epimerase
MKILPSLLAADFLNLNSELDKLTNSGYDTIHYDVMDGSFVPNLSFGDDILSQIKRSNLKFDVHLMTNNVESNVKRFIKQKPEFITFHYEAVEDKSQIISIIKLIQENGIKAGLVIKPETSVQSILEFSKNLDMILVMSVEPGFGGQKFIPESIQKIKELANYRVTNKCSFIIEVDGGVNNITGKLCLEAGADYLVVGSYLFKKEDYSQVIKNILEENND